MKICIFTDNHFCRNSSIIKARGNKYSLRLENQIKSLNWVEQVALDNKCDAVICLGDFFDKPILNDEELTALKDIKWNNLKHIFIVGNHESSVNGLSYNSTKALQIRDNFFIVDKPYCLEHVNQVGSHEFYLFLPYIIETDRKSLKEYLGNIKDIYDKDKLIIFSHNDIKGIQMGPIMSKTGFDIKEIENSCRLFINGHLHNGTKFCLNGINLGNLTGQNFSENAFIYKHQIMILDTDTFEYELIENPYAFNFYKLEINTESDLDKLYNIKDNSALNIACKSEYLTFCKTILQDLLKNKIIYSRITEIHSKQKIDNISIDDLRVDHLKEFVLFSKEKLGDTSVLQEELLEICK